LIDDKVKGDNFSVFEEIKKPIIFINFGVVLVGFSVVSFNYYLISFYLKYAGGNIFINTIATNISEGAGNFGASFIQKCVGTKRSFII